MLRKIVDNLNEFEDIKLLLLIPMSSVAYMIIVELETLRYIPLQKQGSGKGFSPYTPGRGSI